MNTLSTTAINFVSNSLTSLKTYGRRLLKAKDVSQILNVGLSTVYAYSDRGILNPIYLPLSTNSKAVKHNKRFVRFSLEEIQQFIHTCQRNGLNSQPQGGEQ